MAKKLMTVNLACGKSYQANEEEFKEVTRNEIPGFDFGGFIYKTNDEEHHIFKPLITSISYRSITETIETEKRVRKVKKIKDV